MAKKCGFLTFILLIFTLLSITSGGALEYRTFNVMDYGAIADGKTDNAQVS